jgi:hypothetical protein
MLAAAEEFAAAPAQQWLCAYVVASLLSISYPAYVGSFLRIFGFETGQYAR